MKISSVALYHFGHAPFLPRPQSNASPVPVQVRSTHVPIHGAVAHTMRSDDPGPGEGGGQRDSIYLLHTLFGGL